MTPRQFQQRLLHWFDRHGRKDMPWQINKTPYRVWVSEIMLQQTQVKTVIPYYLRFMARFPDIQDLADASEDDVLHLWTGLGYYSRARNLLKTAKIVSAHFHGQFPDTLDELIQLPGIGHSTAGAILSIAFGQRATILDGNVKRVLARVHHITAPINQKQTEAVLWEQAVRYTPKTRAADYTQAIMDLGATVCTRSKPTCPACPLRTRCEAHAAGTMHAIPVKATSKPLPVKSATLLLLKQGSRVLLAKRPAKGIWGGLWSLPELTGEAGAPSIRAWIKKHLGVKAGKQTARPAFRHTFSHYHLDIHPVVIELDKADGIPAGHAIEGCPMMWYSRRKPEVVGLPKPIQTLLRETT